MGPNLGLSTQHRKAVADLLSATLADEYVVYTKTRNYHWNVVGPSFNEFHKFFESQYEALNDIVDDVAERIRSIGHPALGTLSEFSRRSRVKEQPGDHPAVGDMVRNLLADHEAIVRRLRDDVDACADEHHDTGTSDFLTALMERHEKMAWMLRSMTEAPAPRRRRQPQRAPTRQATDLADGSRGGRHRRAGQRVHGGRPRALSG